MNQTENAFFKLIRAGLWEDVLVQGTSLTFSASIDWQEVYRIAEEQSVIGLVAAGLGKLDVRKKKEEGRYEIPKDIFLTFIGQALVIEQRNKAMNEYVAWLIERLREEDVYVVLVKGQGVAQCYERPMWRSAGDIDFLLDDNNFEKAKLFFIPLANKIEEESNYARHLGMTIDSWVVELHGTLRCGLSKKIDKVIDSMQNESCCGGAVRIWRNGNTEVFLPTVNNDILFVFTHFLNHFYKEGVGLRQICDWCRLLWKYRKEIDIDLLQYRLKEMRLTTEWKAFASFAVNYLGMPSDAMPLFENKDRWKRKASCIKSFILEVGNFGHNRDLSYYNKYPFIIRKTISVFHRLRDVMRHAKLFPLDSFRFLPNMMWVGLQNVK